MRIIAACALAHLINDLIQAVLPSIYPMLKANYGLSFAQVGMITLTFQITASLLQPWVGFYTDRKPMPNLLPLGTLCTLVGIVMLAYVGSFPMILLAAALVGIGSSTFHPETSRIARLASGGRFGLAQSTFQVGVMPALRLVLCWQQRSSFRSARAMSPGLACSLYLRYW